MIKPMKKFTLILAIFVLFTGCQINSPDTHESNSSTGSSSVENVTGDTKQYMNTDVGLSFSYPKNYSLSTSQESYEKIRVDLFPDVDYPQGEGPGITVRVFPNPQNMKIEDWLLKNEEIASYYSKPETLSLTLDSESAKRYKAPGLSEQDIVAVSSPDNVYLFIDTGTGDFESLLHTVKFL
jgi:hypothetical protein